MEKIGRNERCPCGSGRKYKKCCLHKTISQSVVKSLNEAELSTLSAIKRFFTIEIPEAELPISAHNLTENMRQFVAARLEQILLELRKENKNAEHLQFLNSELYQLYLQGPSYASFRLKKLTYEGIIFERPTKTQAKDRLCKAELSLLKTVASANLSAFLAVPNESIDYEAMRVLTEFGYASLLHGFTDDDNISGGKMIVDATNTLVGWELLKDTDSTSTTVHTFPIRRETAPPLDFTTKVDWAHYQYLNKSSIHTLTTVHTQEAYIESSQLEPHCYCSLATSLLGVLEQELREVITLNEQWNTGARLLWRDLQDYLKYRTLPYISDNVPYLYEQLTEITTIRKQALYGERIDASEYSLIHDLAFSQGLLASLSKWKEHYYSNITAISV
ncbi:SEC-C metal-binding domain-containing protein [Bacillus tianshenii]|nr:SEC-C metal-binding domain-containing protein [Bacillus tianshenii]